MAAHEATCNSRGITFANDINELVGRLGTNFVAGPWRPIVKARPAVIIKSI